jgi:hypothetical protein
MGMVVGVSLAGFFVVTYGHIPLIFYKRRERIITVITAPLNILGGCGALLLRGIEKLHFSTGQSFQTWLRAGWKRWALVPVVPVLFGK